MKGADFHRLQANYMPPDVAELLIYSLLKHLMYGTFLGEFASYCCADELYLLMLFSCLKYAFTSVDSNLCNTNQMNWRELAQGEVDPSPCLDIELISETVG